MRYYIANQDGIPFHEQPTNGYTRLQVIARLHREIEECIKLFGGVFQDYKDCFVVLDSKFRSVDFSDII